MIHKKKKKEKEISKWREKHDNKTISKKKRTTRHVHTNKTKFL